MDKIDIDMPDEEIFEELAGLYKVLGDPTRAKILYLLSLRETGVNAVADTLGISQSAVSHQLRVLRQARLVRHRKSGRSVYYCLDDIHVDLIFSQGLEHIREYGRKR